MDGVGDRTSAATGEVIGSVFTGGEDTVTNERGVTWQDRLTTWIGEHARGRRRGALEGGRRGHGLGRGARR
jgi:hypothetical protein